MSTVSVHLSEDQKAHKATFHAQTVEDGRPCDLDFEIPQDLYEVLVEYTRLGNPDLVLMLFHENNTFKWSVMSESWLKKYSNTSNGDQYVV